ncbi:MAG: tetratricopeptide repeat protein, partial [Phycisphaerales bacterium JB059]
MAEVPSFRAIDRLFQNVCDLDERERARVLREREATDPELVSRVRALLDAERELAPELERALGSGMPTPSPACPDPDHIGPYRVIRPLGEGGMGVVYEAHQESPSRHVAIKLIRSGLLSANLLRRFEFEAEILGRLKHPGIAQVHEANTTPDGLPYFVMELIEGRPLSEHAEQRRLGTRERLELFVDVCEAVEHAHRKGVVHRDLKPANILVTEEGRVKVLDFGVARAVGDEACRATLQTSPGQIIGTPAYMSPEQATSAEDAVDTLADVYSLGVVLYELLGGCLPIDVEDATIFEALRRVREQTPTRLGIHRPALRGDLETIAAKALEKDVARRYESVAELGRDVTRYLRDEPILARPATTMYQLRMFAKRRRSLVIAVAAATLLLVAGTTVSSILAVERTIARDNARDERDAAVRVNRFLTEDLLAAAMPANLGREVTVREAVDVAAASIGAEFLDRPLIRSSIQEAVGGTYMALGEWEKAERFLRDAMATHARIARPDPARAIRMETRLAMLAGANGRYEQAERELRSIAERARASLDRPDLASDADASLAIVLRERGRYEEAETLQRELIRDAVARFGDSSVEASERRSDLSATLQVADRRLEAIPVHEQALRTLQEHKGDANPSTISALAQMGSLLLGTSEPEQAENYLREASELASEHLGPDHPTTVIYVANLGTYYSNLGRSEEAEPLLAQAVEFADRVLGPDHPITMGSVSSLGVVYAQRGDHARAAPLLNRSADDMRRQLGEVNPRTITAKAN